ncbi:MAG TPA: delta-60 repeat domain-containing protein [Pyrinomonadaceae bacterium]|nr:delta-60 repeat domain-containing protein [Pyrinomonadaceae bacterium]
MNKSTLITILFAAFVIMFQVFETKAAPGDLDTSFGILGQVYDNSLVTIHGSAIQADGKIIAVGNKSSIPTVVRYNVDGSLDYGFGTNGSVFGDTTYGIFNSVVVQEDGKIVAAGRSDNNAFVIRLNTNGTFDNSFSGDGKLMITFGTDFYSTVLESVTIAQNTGKIVVAGTIFYDSQDNPCVQGSNLVFARINSNGTLDTTFDGNGKKAIDLRCRDVLTSTTVNPTNGKIAFTTEGNGDFEVGMLNENGSFDTGFGGTGLVETDFNGTTYSHDRATSVAFQRWATNVGGILFWTTRLVVGGTAYGSSTTVYDWGLARYKLDGTPDTAFNGDGKVRKALSYQYESVESLKIDSQQRIVTAGRRTWNNTNDFAVVRFTRDGEFDNAFGNGGKVYTKFYANGAHTGSVPYDVSLAPDGKIVAVGGGSNLNAIMARYEP